MHKQIVDACKFLRCFARCPICGQNSLLITNLSVFTLISTLTLLTTKPMIGFTSIAQEGMMLLVWTKIPITDDYVPKPKQKKQKKGLPKVYDKVFEDYFLYIPRGVVLFIQGNVAHTGGFCFGQTGLKQETNHHLHIYCCHNDATKIDVDKGQNHSLLDDRYCHDEDILLSLTKTELPPFRKRMIVYMQQSLKYIC